MFRIKFLNFFLVIAMFASVALSYNYAQAKKLSAEKVATIRMTGGVTLVNGIWKGIGNAKFVLPLSKVAPKTMTVVKTDGRIITVRPWWWVENGQQVMHMNLIDNGQFIYFDTMNYRIVPQGISRRVWEESSTRNAICTKRPDEKPCDW